MTILMNLIRVIINLCAQCYMSNLLGMNLYINNDVVIENDVKYKNIIQFEIDNIKKDIHVIYKQKTNFIDVFSLFTNNWMGDYNISRLVLEFLTKNREIVIHTNEKILHANNVMSPVKENKLKKLKNFNQQHQPQQVNAQQQNHKSVDTKTCNKPQLPTVILLPCENDIFNAFGELAKPFSSYTIKPEIAVINIIKTRIFNMHPEFRSKLTNEMIIHALNNIIFTCNRPNRDAIGTHLKLLLPFKYKRLTSIMSDFEKRLNIYFKYHPYDIKYIVHNAETKQYIVNMQIFNDFINYHKDNFVMLSAFIPPVIDFHGQRQLITNLNEVDNCRQIIIVGDEGVGKTQLVKKFIEIKLASTSTQYDIIVWLNALNEDSFSTCISTFYYNFMRLTSKDVAIKKISIREMFLSVMAFFNLRVLLVFDDFTNVLKANNDNDAYFCYKYAMIKCPNADCFVILRQCENIHLLLQPAVALQVAGFSLEDALSFVRLQLGLLDYTPTQADMAQLVKFLHLNPKALKRATNYIKSQISDTNNKMSLAQQRQKKSNKNFKNNNKDNVPNKQINYIYKFMEDFKAVSIFNDTYRQFD